MEEPSAPHLTRFNVRVYGLLLDNQRQAVLASRERYGGMLITKFPGGGLEFGEGLEDGLKREFIEELGLEVKLGKLFYINDFLQISAFNPQDQLLSIYYLVTPASSRELPDQPQPHLEENKGKLSFRWIPLKLIEPQKFSFPVDKKVAAMLAEGDFPEEFEEDKWKGDR